jgi:pimeloyl-ACP methyl ester carboxylesterase
VILVAHSFSGVIAARVAAKLPDQVAQLVFVAASVPPEGRSVLDTFTPPKRLVIRALLRLQAWSLPPPRALLRRALRRTLCNDLDEVTTQVVLERFVPAEAPALFLEPMSYAGMPDVPCAYIKLLRDRSSLPTRVQERMAATFASTQLLTLDAGHTAMLSRPRELAQQLNLIADGVAARVLDHTAVL